MFQGRYHELSLYTVNVTVRCTGHALYNIAFDTHPPKLFKYGSGLKHQYDFANNVFFYLLFSYKIFLLFLIRKDVQVQYLLN